MWGWGCPPVVQCLMWGGVILPVVQYTLPKLTDASNVSHHAGVMADGRWCSDAQDGADVGRPMMSGKGEGDDTERSGAVGILAAVVHE